VADATKAQNALSEFAKACRDFGYRGELERRIGEKIKPLVDRADLDDIDLYSMVVTVLAGEVEKDMDAMRSEHAELRRRLDALAGDGK